MNEIKPSVCPYDCPDCCGLLVTVQDGRAVHIAGDPNHPFTRGTLCPKMAHYERTVHAKGRIMTPLKRIGKKGEGRFKPISWEAAIAEIAEHWQSIIDDFGAEAILPYSYAGTMGTIGYSAGHPLFYKLGATSLDRTICAPAKSRGYRDVMGATLPTAPQEAQESDMIILWSISMLATDIHFRHDIEIARQRGARIYCIDTYRTKTADCADAFLCPRPGTDGALALAVLHVLAKEGLCDRAFLRRHVQGAEALERKILPRYTPEAAADITGIPAEDIRSFARAYGRARAPFIRLGSGQSRYTNGSMTTRLITCLPAFVGAYAKKGGGLLTSASGSHAFDKSIIRRPDLERPGVRHINMCELGHALNDASLTPPIKALYVYSSNPACTAPDQNQVLRGLQREDLFTVVHERFLTDTARYADIILPATTSSRAKTSTIPTATIPSSAPRPSSRPSAIARATGRPPACSQKPCTLLTPSSTRVKKNSSKSSSPAQREPGPCLSAKTRSSSSETAAPSTCLCPKTTRWTSRHPLRESRSRIQPASHPCPTTSRPTATQSPSHSSTPPTCASSTVPSTNAKSSRAMAS